MSLGVRCSLYILGEEPLRIVLAKLYSPRMAREEENEEPLLNALYLESLGKGCCKLEWNHQEIINCYQMCEFVLILIKTQLKTSVSLPS